MQRLRGRQRHPARRPTHIPQPSRTRCCYKQRHDRTYSTAIPAQSPPRSHLPRRRRPICHFNTNPHARGTRIRDTVNHRQDRRTQQRVSTRLHSDNSLEYHAHSIHLFLTANGIEQSFTSAYQPQSNSLAERFNRSLMDAALCALRHAKLPNEFWDCAIIDSTFKYNILPQTTTGLAPLTHWNPHSTTPQWLQPFGAASWVPIPAVKTKGKLSPRARPARCLYPLSHTAIIVLLTDSNIRANNRLSDFHHTHPALDPTNTMRHAFRVTHNKSIPPSVKSATPPPTSTAQARNPRTRDFGCSHTMNKSTNSTNNRP